MTGDGDVVTRRELQFIGRGGKVYGCTDGVPIVKMICFHCRTSCCIVKFSGYIRLVVIPKWDIDIYRACFSIALFMRG